jgi:hypothetical protein
MEIMKVRILETPKGRTRQNHFKVGSIATKIEAESPMEKFLEGSGMFIFRGVHKDGVGTLKQSLEAFEYEIIK